MLVSCYTSRIMTTAFAAEAVHVQEMGHLSYRDIAHATGAGESTARAWLNGTRSPSGDRAYRLAELSGIVERLQGVVEAEYIPVWINKPIRALGDRKPIDLIAKGQYRDVARLISELESPTFS